ncbi:MAG: deoxyguanosinetriphosphate triphosphohydrolase [Clostridia bacterium]|nr:deoxyguanosinetriphosphate triphosphohydrolase [Clostridia bacterium]
MTIKDRIELLEEENLSPYAAKSKNATRSAPDTPNDMRGEFQRDRDRIIHSKAFRRLMHKTQVFISPQADHYRTRLTHTFEVMQIARSIARALMLNEDLTEAISLGHDLGHTPFGHAGERALSELFKAEGGFDHACQSVRVVRFLEKDGRGLNLTDEVCDGILNHSTGKRARTLEGRIVNLADKIAYINHDIDDAISAGLLSSDALPGELTAIFGDTGRKRIDTMIRSVVEYSRGKDDVKMEPGALKAMYELRKFLFASVYNNPKVKGEEPKVHSLINRLFDYFTEHPDRLPRDYSFVTERDGVRASVRDYIAGMTDRYALEMYKSLFLPKSFTMKGNE